MYIFWQKLNDIVENQELYRKKRKYIYFLSRKDICKMLWNERFQIKVWQTYIQTYLLSSFTDKVIDRGAPVQ